MTREEYLKSVVDEFVNRGVDRKDAEEFGTTDTLIGGLVYGPNKSHRQAILVALCEGKPIPPEVFKDYPDIDPNSEKPSWYINADDRPVYTVPSDAMGCRGPYSETEVSELTGTDYSYLKDAIQGKPVFTPDYPESRYKS